MARLCVWAPETQMVEIIIEDSAAVMKQENDGWWSLDSPFLTHGTDYGFLLDGEGPFPDPRSPWQPEGVHGLSRYVDHRHFTWKDSTWKAPPFSSALVYELHVGTFTPQGTFLSAIEKLDHLVDLGITHVELMPVAEFSGSRGWGYDGVDLYAPHHDYGGPEALKKLVNACHNKGLAVLLDVVYNHLGPDGNYLGRFGPYFTDRYVTPWGEAVNLDGPESGPVRRFFIDNALMWLRDYHIDGLRIDAVHAIVDTSAIHFLEQLAQEVKNLEAHLRRHFVLIAESDLNDPRVIRPPQVGGYGIHAQWNEDFHHSLHAVLTGERDGYYRDFGKLRDLAKVMKKGFVYDGCYSIHRRRRHGRKAEGISGSQFVACLQNHDQVGNRANGERSSHLLTPGHLKIGAAIVLTSPFIPMWFQGEEWAASSPFLYFTDHQDTKLAEAVRKGRREEFAAFGWDPEKVPDPQSEETFQRSKLVWNELKEKHHEEIWHWYRELIDLRCRVSELQNGSLDSATITYDEKEQWFAMERGSIIVVCNFSDTEKCIPCSRCARKKPVLLSDPEVLVQESAIILPRISVAILEQNMN